MRLSVRHIRESRLNGSHYAAMFLGFFGTKFYGQEFRSSAQTTALERGTFPVDINFTNNRGVLETVANKM